MTLERLEQYRNMRAESKMWERELDELRRKSRVVKDTVRGSLSSFPYTMHPVTIRGLETKPNKRILRREARLRERRERLEQEREEIEDFIDTVDDSQVRQIIHYRYIKGYQWPKTALLMHNKESTVKMRWKRFCDHNM